MKKNDSWNFHKINKWNLKIKTKKRWRIVRDTQITVISIGPVVFSIFLHGKQDTTKVAHLNTHLNSNLNCVLFKRAKFFQLVNILNDFREEKKCKLRNSSTYRVSLIKLQTFATLNNGSTNNNSIIYSIIKSFVCAVLKVMISNEMHWVFLHYECMSNNQPLFYSNNKYSFERSSDLLVVFSMTGNDISWITHIVCASLHVIAVNKRRREENSV